MKTGIFSIVTVVAVAFALVAGIGAFNSANAAPYTDGQRAFNLPAGDVNAFGADLAGNSPRTADRDFNSNTRNFAPDTYGINGTLRP